MSSRPLDVLTERFDRALVSVFGADLAGVDPVLRRSDRADYQSNVALALKKRGVKEPPRDAAAKIVAALDVADVCSNVEVSGPGFINLTLRDDFLAAALQALADDPRLGVDPTKTPETVVIDYSSPNIAKELHAGHLRSTIIGDALARTLEHVGHRVVRQNHLGDWGTPFGMLIEHMLDVGESVSGKGVGDLNDFYRDARKKFDESPDFADRSRRRVVQLQSGDAQTLALWKQLVDASKQSFYALYDQLGISMKDADAAGESLFNDRLADTVHELQEKGLAVESDGALCVFPPGFKGKDGPVPLIVRKSDGGYGYATTDLAAIKYRIVDLGASRVIYVVGSPQAQHLSMIFKAAELAGWLKPPARAEHVGFGSVLGEDGKMLKARSGESVKLKELVDEGEEKALAVVREKNQLRKDKNDDPLSDEEEREVAHAVGIAAIKYADLGSDRVKDYVFSWQRMLATEGNTGPYLQYAHARNRSILRKATDAGAAPGKIVITTPEERAVALSLLGLGAAVHDVAATLEPHRLCTYLYELAGVYGTFYDRCPVLRAETEELRASRVSIVALTANVIATGLGLLGIQAPQRM